MINIIIWSLVENVLNTNLITPLVFVNAQEIHNGRRGPAICVRTDRNSILLTLAGTKSGCALRISNSKCFALNKGLVARLSVRLSGYFVL